jgi:hypothetical protein
LGRWRQRSEEEQLKAETEIGIAATRFKAAECVREPEKVGAIAAGERKWRARLAAEREASGESRRISRDAPSRRKCGVQRAPYEIGEVVGNHMWVATAQFKIGEDGESDGCVSVKHRGGELRNMFGAREAKQLFNVCGAERVHAGGEELIEHRLSIAHPAVGEAREKGDRLWLRVALLRLQDLGELPCNLVLRDRSEVESLQARKDCRTNARRIGGTENEDDARWRLLEPLEERVPGVIGEAVHLVKDEDLPLQVSWRVGDEWDQIFADIINAVGGGGV